MQTRISLLPSPYPPEDLTGDVFKRAWCCFEFLNAINRGNEFFYIEFSALYLAERERQFTKIVLRVTAISLVVMTSALCIYFIFAGKANSIMNGKNDKVPNQESPVQAPYDIVNTEQLWSTLFGALFVIITVAFVTTIALLVWLRRTLNVDAREAGARPPDKVFIDSEIEQSIGFDELNTKITQVRRNGVMPVWYRLLSRVVCTITLWGFGTVIAFLFLLLLGLGYAV